GDRPDADTFKEWIRLYNGETDVTDTYADQLTVTDNGNNTYTVAYSGLPENGYSYSIKEVIPDGQSYTSDVSETSDGGTITNTINSVNVSVYKKWADSGQENSRPSTDDVKSWFTLYDADGNVVDATPSIQVSDTDSTVYTVTYENLDPGSYTVKENVPASYNYATYYESGKDYAVASSSGMTTASTIINAPKTSQETDTELTVTKVSSNNTSTKLSGAEFKLYSDAACTEQLAGSPTLTTGTDGVVTISTGADYLKRLLPTSDEDTTVIYLKETKAPDSYTASDTVYPIVLGQETTSAWNNDHTSYVTTKTHTIYYQKDTNVSSSDIQVENTPYTEIELKAQKTLSGANLSDKQFSFTLTAADENAKAALTADTDHDGIVTASNDASGNISFGNLKFTEAGTYTYTIREVLAGTATSEDPLDKKTNIQYDTAEHTAVVTVSQNTSDGTLSASVTYDGNAQLGETGPTFQNVYYAPVDYTLTAKKTLSGKTLAADEFSFTLTADSSDENYTAAKTALSTDEDGDGKVTVKNSADGTISFSLHFDQAGTYKYTLQEDAGSETGVTYDTAPHAVLIEVKAESGSLVPYVKYDNNENTSVTFSNEYFEPVSATIEAEKTVAGSGYTMKEGDFEFTLSGDDADSQETLEGLDTTVSNKEDGSVTFPEIQYTKKGTYSYTISEVIPSESEKKGGITYTTDTHQVTVRVLEDKTSHKLTKTVTYDNGNTQKPVFQNTYASSGSTVITASKKLTGSLLQDQQFQFRLQGSDDSVDQTVANDANGNITFDEIKYTKAGTYHYTLTEVVPDGVTETNPTKDNITYDLTEYTVVVQVEDGNDGTLNVTSVTYNGKSTAPVFTNHYAASVTAGIEAHKQLNNGTLEKGQFSFTLQGISENAKDFTKTVKNSADGTVDFGDIEYNEEGTYEYTIKENLPEGVDEKNPVKDGISYDTSTHYVTVVVTPGVEQLSATVMYDNSEEAAEPTFVNTESDSVDVQLEASKVLKNATLSAGEFSFRLTGSGENTEDTNLTASNDENGKVVFPHLTYDQAGTYRYKMSEIIPENKITGMTYDSTEHEVLVEVTMDNGVLKAYVVYDNSDIEKPVFTNEYNAPCDVTLKATKTLKNRTLKKNEFEFSLTDITDSLNPKELGTKRNDASGNVTFDEITYTKAGTYRYRIEEVIPEEKEAGLTYDTSVHTVVVQVTKNNGKLVPTVVYDNSTTAGAASFTNTYIGSISIPVEKTWAKGVSGESATVLLKQDGKQIGDSVELNEKNHWKHTFENLPKFTEDGHEYQYTVEETNSNYKVTVVQNDESDVSKGFTINNDQSEEKTELKVTKEWTDGASGEYAEVELYQDGNPTGQTERLTEDNDWTHTFTGLDKYGKDGHTIKYTVVENSDNYTIEYKTNDDGSITVVNSPKAGDIHTTVGVDGTKSTSDNELTVDYAKLTDQKGHVVDTVSYTGLNTSKTYTIVGRLMDVTDEDSETIVAQASEVFQPTETDGSVDVDFGEVALESGHKYVVYEYLYTGEIPDREENDKNHELPEDETPTKEHQDKHDKSQTFVTVEIHTTVGVDGTKSTSDNELTVDYAKLTDQKGHVVDTVSYTGLDTTKTYTVVGRLMDVTDDSSEEIVAQASEVFQPTETDGSVDVDFGEVALESGHKYVVYEYLYTGTIPEQEENDKNHELPKDETPTAEHHDKHDKSQTFVTVEIHTTVGVDGTKSSSDNELTVDYAKLTDQKGHVVDTVSYTGLDTTKTYTVVGRLMDVTDDGSEEIVAQASEVFQPTETDGSVDVDFGEVALESGHTYVVYEYLYTGEIPDREENDKKNELPKDETPTAEHHDQHDKSQTFVTVEIHTTVGVDGTKSTSAQELTVDSAKAAEEHLGKVTDTVSYTGLDTTKTYTVVGRLMDVTDEANETIVVQTSKEFRPYSANGSVDVEFGKVDLTAGHRYVVYEYLYTGEIPDQEENDKKNELPKDETPTAEHHDKHDKSQTFVTVEIHTTVGVDGTKSTSEQALSVDFTKLTEDHKGQVADTVSYTGLDTAKTYTVVGRLMDVTDEDSETIVAQASKVFQPTETDGSVDVDFGEVALESGHTYVVYEYLYTGEIPDREENDKKNELPKDETPTAEHHDKHDKSQTFTTTEITSVPVEKKWAEGVSGEEAVIVLVKNGEETDQTITLTEENSWKGTFENLPKYDENGNEISYSVTERTDTYNYTVESDNKGGYIVTNSDKPVETVEIPVEKKWADGASGEEAVIVLVKNGAETTQALVLTEENNWKGSFKNLPKYDDSGKEIEYSVTEKTNSYNYQVDGTQETGFVVTNSPKTEKISIPVKKEWADESNTSAVTFELLRNGTSIKTITLDAGNNWSGSFDNLDKTDSDGNEYTYTVRETGYWVNVQTVDEASGTVTVKNVYLPQTPGGETTDLSVYKKWAAGLEKEAVTVQLLQNGEAVEGGTVTLSADNNWSCSFDNLPKYDENGNEYLYSVEEIGGKWLYELTWNSDGSITITNRERNTASTSDSTSSGNSSNLSGSSSTTGIGSPKTGDSSNIAAYITLLIAAAAGVLILVSEKRRKK
ncbi:MAG: Spy0128 family protein, partial [Bilifractor sp.]